MKKHSSLPVVILIAVLGLLSPLFAAATAPPDLASLRTAIEQEIKSSGKQVGVAIKELETGRQLVLNDDTAYPMASTYKIPIMVEVYRQLREGRFRMDDRVEMTEFDRNSVNYLNEFGPGLKLTIRDLITMMIIVTDSSATDMLLRRVEPRNVADTMQALGCSRIHVDRTVEDILWDFLGFKDKATLEQKPYRERAALFISESARPSREKTQAAIDYYNGSRDVAHPSDMARLLEAIFRERVIDPEASRQMLATLYRQRLNFAMPRMLPRATPVAHKTGNLGTVANDVGIIDLPNGNHLVTVIFTKKVPPSEGSGRPDSSAGLAGIEVIPRIAKLAYDFFTTGRLAPIARPNQAPQHPYGQAATPPSAELLAGGPASADQMIAKLKSFAGQRGIRLGIAARNLQTGKTIYLNERQKFPMSGTLTMPLLLAAYREVDTGALKLTDRWTTRESDRATLGGYMKELEPALNPSVADLIDLMTVSSDATAAQMLMDRLGLDKIRANLAAFGLNSTSIDGMPDSILWDFVGTAPDDPIRQAPFLQRYSEFERRLAGNFPESMSARAGCYSEPKDATTPLDACVMLEEIAAGKVLSTESRAAINEYLRFSLLRLGSPLYGTAPAGWWAVHRPGYMAGIANDLILAGDGSGAKVAISIFTVPQQQAPLSQDDLDNMDYELNFSTRPQLVNTIAKFVFRYLTG